jgi:succinate dehydrogenase/fumarate reductase flavoprotein subunit
MASDLRGELHDFQRFLDDKVDVCRSSISLEQALQQFREYQRDLQRFKDDTRQALEESARGQSSPLDIDDVIQRGKQRLAEKGVSS